MLIPLRDYQARGVDLTRGLLRAGKRRLIVYLPTGGGKTVFASWIIDSAFRKGRRCIFLAHRRELIRQTFCKLLRAGLPPESVGAVMAGVPARSRHLFNETPTQIIDRMRASGASDLEIDSELWGSFAARRAGGLVQVGSIDTVRNRDVETPDLIVVDEAHRAYSPSYLALIQAFPDATVLGLTATPYRADGRSLWETPEGWNRPLFEDIAVIATPAELRDMGYLVPVRMFQAPSEALPALSHVRVRRGEYVAEDVDAEIEQPRVVGDVVRHWLEKASGTRTVLFASSVKASREAARRFQEVGVRAEHLDGTTDAGERDAILSRLDRGETLIVCNCDVLTEGWDQPSVETLILLCPTKSLGKYLQKVGRVLRVFPGKELALILDHAGLVREHGGGPYADRPVGPDGAKRRRRGAPEDEIGVRTCPAPCYAIIPAGLRVCPECGRALPTADRDGPEEVDGELVHYEERPLAERRAAWARLCDERGDRSPRWVRAEYEHLFQVKPPKSWKVPLRDDEKDENDSAIMEAWRGYYQAAHAAGHKDKSACFKFKERFGRWPSKALIEEQRAWIAAREITSTELVEAPVAAPLPPAAPPRPLRRALPPPSLDLQLEAWAV